MIRKATKEDIYQIEKIYDEILDYEEQNISYTNWKKGLYPTKKVAEQALKEGTLFVDDENGTIRGCVILNHDQPAEYKKLNWSTNTSDDKVLVIHTLCIKPSFSHLGIGKEFVNFAEKYGKENGNEVIRLDTYEGNIPAVSLYTKLNFNYVGSTEFYFQNLIHEVLKCFDKIL